MDDGTSFLKSTAQVGRAGETTKAHRATAFCRCNTVEARISVELIASHL
jgi:hypothetical protein